MGLQNEAVYILHNIKAKTVLDLDYQVDGVTVRGWEYTGKNNQKWRAIQNGDSWDFKNLTDAHHLSVWGNHLFEGSSVSATYVAETPWRVEQQDYEKSHGDDVYRLVPVGSTLSLDLENHGSSSNGETVVIGATAQEESQIWRFQKVD